MIAFLAFVPPLTIGAHSSAITPIPSAPGAVPANPGAGALVPVATLLDNQQVSATLAGLHSTLADTIQTDVVRPDQRSYSVVLRALLPFRTIFVNLTTNPLAQWAAPNQVPGGPDVVPPLANWTWQVSLNGNNDTSNWTLLPSTSQLSRSAAWVNATYVVTGVPRFTATVSVTPMAPDGSQAPSLGVVLHSPNWRAQLPPNDPDFPQLLGNLTPRILRWSQSQVNPASWNNSSGRPVFNMTPIVALINMAHSEGAQTMVDLPVGTWGDGNQLPAGMPLNTTLLLTSKSGGSGYFPTLSAYKLFVSTFVSAVAKAGVYIDYWNIGNEVPATSNVTLAIIFSPMFNAAAAAIHKVFPVALVGSDIMTHPWLLPTFAQYATGVGFLEFHYYPADGGCALNNTFCPPNDQNTYYTDPTILTRSAYFAHGVNYFPPHTAQSIWYNVTRHWLPILDTESNLNAYNDVGSDPRQQTLFGATWMVSQLIDAAATGVSSIEFFALQGPYATPGSETFPYGGWGFSLTSEGGQDNDTKYAPYWGLDLWGRTIPAGGAGLLTNSSAPTLVRAYAVGTPSGVNLVVACRSATVTTVNLQVIGRSLGAANYTLLDASTYQMSYNASAGRTFLTQSGVVSHSFAVSSRASITFDGYGVAAVRFVFRGSHIPSPVGASGNGPGPGNPAPPFGWIPGVHGIPGSSLAVPYVGAISYAAPAAMVVRVAREPRNPGRR